APHPSTPVHKGGSAGAGAVAVVADSAPAEAARDSAITVSPPPPPGVDWLGELAGAADATLSREKKAQEQLGALLRKFRIEDDARNPHARPPGSFRWDGASIHRFDTRGSLPVWHLNERCVVVALIFAACAIGHIEVRGDLFEGAAAVHDERLATPRPNDAP
ncbi:MAG TPA: hypothetical protein VMF03_00120, partial [Steroidobacteraceae bacterium]|nr:hypothetical protein [Steroidobacteraceae bacterium]